MDTKTFKYAGIGSRKTPTDMLKLIELVSESLSADGMTLRTGHATGADAAFEAGAGVFSEVFLPWTGYNRELKVYPGTVRRNVPSPEAHLIAKEHHPNWNACSWGAKCLLARNAHILLGENLDDPVEFVLCWAEPDLNNLKPSLRGGTGHAVRIANAYDIPVNNLFWDDIREMAEDWVTEYENSMIRS
jgi:hypothetical protein